MKGRLNRSTPCVDWKIDTMITKDNPPSNVTFEVKKTSTAEICIQVLGSPQEIRVESPASLAANITVKIEGEVVFSGKAK